MVERFRRLLVDAAVYGATTAGAQSVQILLVPVYTRVLSPASYGSVEAVVAAVAILSLVLGMQADSGLARYYYQTDDRAERREMAGTGLALIAAASAVGAAALMMLAAPVAAFVIGDAGQAWVIRLAVLSVPARLVTTYALLVFRLERQRGRYAVIGVGWVLLSVALSVLFVVGFGMELAGVFGAMMAADMIAAICALALARPYLAPAFSRATARRLLGYGLPLVPAASGQWGLRYLDRFFILALLSRTHLGIYAVAVQISSVVLFLDRAFALAWTPFAMELIGEKDSPAVFAKALVVYLLVITACGMALSIFAREIVALAAPAVYAPAALLVPILVATWIGRGIFRVVSTGVSVAAKTGYSLVAFAAGLAVNLALLALLVPRWGLAGAASAGLAGTAITAAAGYVFAQRLFHVPYRLDRAVGMLAVFGFAAASVLALEGAGYDWAIVLPAKAVLLAAGWIATCALAFDPPERQMIARAVRRKVLPRSNAGGSQ